MFTIPTLVTGVTGLFSAARWAHRLAVFRDGHGSFAGAAAAWAAHKTGSALGTVIAPRTILWAVAVIAIVIALIGYTWIVADWQHHRDARVAAEAVRKRNVALEQANVEAVAEIDRQKAKRDALERAARELAAAQPDPVPAPPPAPAATDTTVQPPPRVVPLHTPPDLLRKLNEIH